MRPASPTADHHRDNTGSSPLLQHQNEAHAHALLHQHSAARDHTSSVSVFSTVDAPMTDTLAPSAPDNDADIDAVATVSASSSIPSPATGAAVAATAIPTDPVPLPAATSAAALGGDGGHSDSYSNHYADPVPGHPPSHLHSAYHPLGYVAGDEDDDDDDDDVDVDMSDSEEDVALPGVVTVPGSIYTALNYSWNLLVELVEPDADGSQDLFDDEFEDDGNEDQDATLPLPYSESQDQSSSPPPSSPQSSLDLDTLNQIVLVSNPNPNMLGSHNLGLLDFVKVWAEQESNNARPGLPVPDLLGFLEQIADPPAEINYSDLRGDFFDIQGLNWAEINVPRKLVRARRRLNYTNYVNRNGSDLDRWLPPLNRPPLVSTDNFFRFKRLQLRRDVRLAHFQLRSILACPTRSQAFYPTQRGVNCMNPLSKRTELAFSTGYSNAAGCIVSSLDAAHGVLLAGTFNGTYFLQNIDVESGSNVSKGQITENPSGITNHIQIHVPRRSSAPIAAIASNDHSFRVMDLTTEQIVFEKQYPYLMNCTASSPDRCLRVMVGDYRNALIVNADTGAVIQELSGHRDHGFACDWADDGYTVATGFQDKSLMIWDARRWTDTSGVSTPLYDIRSEMAGVRGLRFSPKGSGKQILVAAEEADYINIIDAQTFCSKQTIDIFGEIGGVAFSDDGHELNVLCCDTHRGGLLQFERCGPGLKLFADGTWRRQPTIVDNMALF